MARKRNKNKIALEERKLMLNFFLITIQFLSGAVMYSHIIAKIKGIDLRKIRDGNPGSSNLWRAAGWKYGFPALMLDYFKGTFPIAFFVWNESFHVNRYVIAFAALSGILGHAFSPFLKFKGGKAIATTFGAWSVLTKWEGPMVLGTVFTIFSILHRLRGKNKTTPEEDAFRVMIGFAALLIYTMWKVFNGMPELAILYFGNFLIVFYKHRLELRRYLKGV
ncbi:glycerol-3-phosphate acyltransferase [Thermotoga maritima]|uniref:glycerol-3-phosphate acyltransferase n=1 Tax=Thermotoga maritima TaxID=2336 RepID=UPI001E628A5A|nr:glycerol-3-phosphate acyltransferase [Thermotoga maritima]